MMGSREGQGQRAAPLAKGTKGGNDGGVGPFVHEDQIRILYHLLRVETGGVIAAGGKLRIGIAESRQPSLAVVSHQIGKAPAIHRLHGTRLMPQGLQLAQQPALEMSVAVVPAGQQRMGEIEDIHANAPASRPEENTSELP